VACTESLGVFVFEELVQDEAPLVQEVGDEIIRVETDQATRPLSFCFDGNKKEK
jgi:hypothetical protein